jgi:hypothetical protein
MSSGPRKLYIDSRYRSNGSHSDFTFQLAQSIEVPAGTVAIIDTVSVPNVFQTIDSTRNKLYVDFYERPDQVLTLPNGMYNGVTLAAELQAQLNAMGQGTFTVVFDSPTGQLKILATGAGYVVFSERSVLRPYDCLEVIGALDVGPILLPDNAEVTLPHHVDVSGTRVLFLCSSNLGHFSSLGPRGESDILRAVFVDASNGSMIVDRLANPFEFIECAGQQLQSLRFTLRDGNGLVVDLRGRSMAFSIIFLQK